MNGLTGRISFPGDKSLSHRGAMFSVLAAGESHIENISDGGDVASTIACLTQLGAVYEHTGTELRTSGKGVKSLSGSDRVLDCGNSGTSLRLLTGLLCGQDVHRVSLVGDDSLSHRPHKRVIDPLQSLGVNISGRDGSYTPVVIDESFPHGGTVEMTVASAQVKSAVLLAGLYADESVSVVELHKTRDHTENMLRSMGVTITTTDREGRPVVTIDPPQHELRPIHATIPGDPSSAAFFGVAAAVIPGSDITISNLLLNPTRTAWIDALKAMGADIEVSVTSHDMGEITGDVRVRYSELTGVSLSGDIITAMIDELPILALAMSCAHGNSSVRDAAELRVKESDRIAVVADHLRRAGVTIHEHEDGYDIEGGNGPTNHVDIETDGDHRIAMTFVVANYIATGELVVSHEDVISTSFPRFFEIFERLIGV